MINQSIAFALMLVIVAAAFNVLLTSCSKPRITDGEILIALRLEAISLLSEPQEPEPMHTGIPSLDALNRKWKVSRMVPVFPNVSQDDEVAARYGLLGIYKLLVPIETDLAAMIRDYRADPHVDYAELNQPYEIK
jgi:hypothetical protein